MNAENPDERLLKLWVSRETFGAVNWGAGVGRESIDAFLRAAIVAAVRRAVKEAADRGKTIPPGVAKWCDEQSKLMAHGDLAAPHSLQPKKKP